MSKILNKRAEGVTDRYAQSIANSGDWLVEGQPEMTVPFSLSQVISLRLRDDGNALIERTRMFNNQFAGVSFRTAEVMLACDLHLDDLQAEVLAWGVDVAKEVNFRLRHQAKKDPLRTFLVAFDTFVSSLDTDVAHRDNSLFPLAWSMLIEELVMLLVEDMLMRPGHCKITHENTSEHRPLLFLDFHRSGDLDRLQKVVALYGVESYAYMQKIVLEPLSAVLARDSTIPPPQTRRQLYRQMFTDLLEAAPYLLSSDRADRYMFPIPGTSCVAAITFLSHCGCARFAICDDETSMLKGLHNNHIRGALGVAYDGQISLWNHPRRTLMSVFGEEAGTVLEYWFLKQIHERMLSDYLSIEKYYLHGADPALEEETATPTADESLVYVAWAKAVEAEDEQGLDDGVEAPGSPAREDVAETRSRSIPQLRRRYFFKLLERCGVVIEQGKGSEIKLLRKSKHPFRLGSHYGNNPAIPAFLAADILKRLEITEHEWIGALKGE